MVSCRSLKQNSHSYTYRSLGMSSSSSNRILFSFFRTFEKTYVGEGGLLMINPTHTHTHTQRRMFQSNLLNNYETDSKGDGHGGGVPEKAEENKIFIVHRTGSLIIRINK